MNCHATDVHDPRVKRNKTIEQKRLDSSRKRQSDWKNWGPYVSDRAWGTVREDYSDGGDAWNFFPHDHARSRAYRWNEDGLAGICNRHQNLCLSVALWNENDAILKERLFGLAGSEGNHGEDVKEYYFYLDSTPTHSYMKMLYKYPQRAYPYGPLLDVNRSRNRLEPEYELIDTGVFDEDRYFDVFVEYAKADEEDILCKITVYNRGPEPAPIHVLPHVWFRNTWSWGYQSSADENGKDEKAAESFLSASITQSTQPSPAQTDPEIAKYWNKPLLKQVDPSKIECLHRWLGRRYYYLDNCSKQLFTENETNNMKCFGVKNTSPHVKDSINDYIVNGKTETVNPANEGTKAAGHFHSVVGPGDSFEVRIRFSDQNLDSPFEDFESILEQRKDEADEFFEVVQEGIDEEERRIQRQAFAGLLWSKQYYHYGVDLWLKGDPAHPPPPRSRRHGRNAGWRHLYCADVISMPDKWEYPWFAAWDLAFHCIPLAIVDPEWAKRQLILVLREWYMHPSGQIPAYEWNFFDVNPPVHAWACLHVYRIARYVNHHSDIEFLEKVFHKLLLNFTWWVNRKDSNGNNVFEGGFLGLDNIGVFDRSSPLPTGGFLQQADATAWMAMYCLNMLSIALEIAQVKPAYEDIATKFLEHFIYIGNAISSFHHGNGLWDDIDGFFYDSIILPNNQVLLKVQSMVGLVPLFAVATLEMDVVQKLPKFYERFKWFKKHRPHLVSAVHDFECSASSNRIIFSIVDRTKLVRILSRMLDEDQFLSNYGIRSLSKAHEQNPFVFRHDNQEYSVKYDPAESTTAMFGGNSNWRGPIWFPLNFLLVESLRIYYEYYGDDLLVPFPSRSANLMSLNEVSIALSHRLINLFRADPITGRKAFVGQGKDAEYMDVDPNWKDHLLFYEYFHGDNGAGLGAAHQTGWTSLVGELIARSTVGSKLASSLFLSDILS